MNQAQTDEVRWMNDTIPAPYWKTLGQDHVTMRLTPALEQGREAHAYLITGPAHVGKMTLAKEIAQAVNCLNGPGAPCHQCSQCQRIEGGIHSDVRLVDTAYSRAVEGRDTVNSVTIGAVREVQRTVNLNPFEGRRSVVIIDGADEMRDEASNALLKTLEEPPPQVMFILIAKDDEDMLSTIRSRCQHLRLQPMAREAMLDHLESEHGASPQQADLLHRLSRGCLGWAIRAVQDPDVLGQRNADLEQMIETMRAGLDSKFNYADQVAATFGKDRGAAKELLSLWLRWWRDMLLTREGDLNYLVNADHQRELLEQSEILDATQIAAFIRRINQTIYAMEANANPKLAMETLMINMP